jgi:hypothetical protein
MLVLHPYSSARQEDQLETWEFLNLIRGRFTVIDAECVGIYGYNTFLSTFWGQEDLIIVEQDIVPTLLDLDEIIACPEPYCVFPYAAHWKPVTTLIEWRRGTVKGLGFVKIEKEAQALAPVKEWEFRTSWRHLDEKIFNAFRRRGWSYHIHERAVKHNHGHGKLVLVSPSVASSTKLTSRRNLKF